MCNWVLNRISIKGNNLNRINKHFSKLDTGESGDFDFNTIVPMPKELDVEKSSQSRDGFLLYIAKINPLIPEFGNKEEKLSMKKFGELMVNHFPDVMQNLPKYILKKHEIDSLRDKYQENFNKVVSLGETVFNNKIKYDYTDWYDWRYDNWGCKWNASETWSNEDHSMFTFSTPWSPCIPIISKLSLLYPDLEIIHEFAEEQTGWYVGKYIYKNGELIEALDYDEYSKEAFELYFDLWGDNDSYKYNPKLNTYEYIGE